MNIILMKYSKGFTIIELIVVISIIAILTTIIVSKVAEYNGLSQDTAVKANMHQLATAGTIYTSNDNSSNFCNSAGDTSIGNAISKINPKYNFHCEGSGGSYAPPPPIVMDYDEDGNLIPPAITAGGENTRINPNCTSGKWYAHTDSLNGGGCWCVDSQGNSNNTCGSAGTCSCEQAQTN